MTFLPRTRPKPSKTCPPLNFLVTAANLRLFCENYSFRCYLLYIFRRKADIRAMLQPVLLGISGTCALVLRRSNIEAITQRELDATGNNSTARLRHRKNLIRRNWRTGLSRHWRKVAMWYLATCSIRLTTRLDKVMMDHRRSR